MSIALISGSPSASSRSARLLEEVRHRLSLAGQQTDWISVRDLPAEPLLHAQESKPISAAIASVLNARAVVIASPIYKVAYSGLLKAFLDLLPEKALDDKFVLPISCAGSPHHAMALDFSIRPVLAALGAREVIPPVCALDAHIVPLPSGHIDLDAQISLRLDQSIHLLLNRVGTIDSSARQPYRPSLLRTATALSFSA